MPLNIEHFSQSMKNATLYAAAICNSREETFITPMQFFIGMMKLEKCPNLWALLQRIKVSKEELKKALLEGYERIQPFEKFEQIPATVCFSPQLEAILRMAKTEAVEKTKNNTSTPKQQQTICIGVREFMIGCAVHNDNGVMSVLANHKFTLAQILRDALRV